MGNGYGGSTQFPFPFSSPYSYDKNLILWILHFNEFYYAESLFERFFKIILLITKISLKWRTWKAFKQRGGKKQYSRKAIVKRFDLIFLLLNSWQYYKLVLFLKDGNLSSHNFKNHFKIG